MFAFLVIAGLSFNLANSSELSAVDKALTGSERGYFEQDLAPLQTQLAGVQQLSCPQNFTGSKGFLNIVMGFGYDDGSDEFVYNGKDFGRHISTDIYKEEALRLALAQPCQGNLQACGFHSDGAGLMTKKMNNINVQITLVHGSYSSDYYLNKSTYQEEQEQQSEAAESAFFDVCHRDAVIYAGHSRRSGGPDFRPPQLAGVEPDYGGYYARHRPGITRLTQALAQPECVHPNFIAIASCLSKSAFYRSLVRVAPDAMFALTNGTSKRELVSDEVAIRSPLAALDAYLRMQCPETFEQELSYARDDHGIGFYLLMPQ